MSEHRIVEHIQKTSPTHASIPFWSWNDRLEPESLRAQIRRMKELGMGGFFMHARGGLETEYLSDEWFRAILACIDEAKKQGMEAWSYDENGWPSGFAGGVLLKDAENHALGLEPAVEDAFPSDEKVLAVYRMDDGGCTRIDGPAEEGTRYYVVRLRVDKTYVDTMNPAVTDKFLACTHEEYKRRIPAADFGTHMPGFFTDEPQYFRWSTPYSRILPDAFAERYGYDIRQAFPALFWDFEGCEAMRYDYYSLCHDLFINGFMKPVYNWCEENGVQLTGHGIEEWGLGGQMMCCGGVMPVYAFEHLPGIDYLGRGLNTDLAAKQIGSVCAQLRKDRAITETFACCGWDVSPRELRNIAELQYVGGLNMMCQHLYPYSSRGQRKRDYPAHYSETLQWQDELADFNRYFNHLGAALSYGSEAADVLVIHPMHSAYLRYKRKDNTSLADNDRELRELLSWLGDRQIPYHFGDERLMADMAAVEGDGLRVGACRYSYVLIPDCDTLDASTVALLREYLRAGGKLAAFGRMPTRVDGHPADLSDIAANITLDALAEASPLHITRGGELACGLRAQLRRGEGGKLLYLKNLTGEDMELALHLRDFGNAALLSMDDLSLSALRSRCDGTDLAARLQLEAGHAVVIIESATPAALDYELPFRTWKAISLSGGFTFDELPENMMTLDRARLSVNGGEFTEERPIECIRDNLLFDRFAGRITLAFRFTADICPEKLLLVAEPAKGLSITLNGKNLPTLPEHRIDHRFLTFDAADAVVTGENEILLSMDYFQRDEVFEVLYGGGSESVRNCLCFDTEIENIYLFGSFAVATDADAFTSGPRFSEIYTGGFRLTAQRAEVDPTSLVKDGYPFYGGRVRLRTTLDWKPGDPAELLPGGRWAVMGVEVNGCDAGTLIFDTHMDLTPWLREGKNDIVLSPCCALRNLMGPFHRENPEPTSVGPNTFSYEKEWKGTVCPAYLARYSFVRFGIDRE
ncbi:MAG: hypothetical protein IKL89_03800 [Clostridia bacterium]|nr:hypothetical protein [Clostridia bacterium]